MPLLSRRKSVIDHVRPDFDPRTNRESDSSFATAQSGLLRPSGPPSPVRPVSESGYHHHSRLSHEVQPDEISDAEPAYDARRSKRFSLMKFRNFSESHLAARAKMDMDKLGEELPPVPSVTADGVVPAIVKTAPTMESGAQQPEAVEESEDEAREGRTVRPSLFQRASSRRRISQHPKTPRKSMEEKRNEKPKGNSFRWRRGKNNGLDDLHRLSTMHLNSSQQAPPPSYGDESTSALAIPVSHGVDPRISESSRSDGSNGSSGDGHIYGSTTTTTQTVSTHTTFFKLPRRNKNRNSLFPLPVKMPPPIGPSDDQDEGPTTPRASTSASISQSPVALGSADTVQDPNSTLRRRHTETSPTKRGRVELPSPHVALAKSALSFAEPGISLHRNTSQRSRSSTTSSPLQPPVRFNARERSSTTSSYGRMSQDVETPPPPSASGRNSTSTMSRASFGGLLTLGRFRHGSEPHSPHHGSPGTNSKSNSFALSREALVVPEREEGDTPGKYLERLEAAVSRSLIAGILSKSADPFAQTVLRSYTRRFPFFGEPIDMSLRKFLLEAELPKETQQVDRVIQAFADRYHECNPGIFVAPDQAYVIAFSIMMLHTDAFNKNNKRKMQKQDYIKNTSGQGLSDDILACFYDNICYTPFVHYEEEVDVNGEKVLPFKKPKKAGGKLKAAIPGADVVGKKSSGPLDPYNLLVDQKLDQLRPALKDSIALDDPYNYFGSQGELDVHYLQRAFTHTGVLQIISARSRPAAYESHGTDGTPDPGETQQGIVDLKITKVGILWRKSAKKKKTRSPWQEWGAVLTGSRLYLFKNSHWAKGLVNQFLTAQRQGKPRVPVTFKPPLQDFRPDAHIKTDDAVALVDATYTRHKHAFTFVRPGGQEEVLLADSESDLNDWLGLINYAAAFRAAGVRIRGMLGGTEEETGAKNAEASEAGDGVQSIQTTMGETRVQNRGLSPQLQRQVMAARRQLMVQKICDLEKDIAEANRQLDSMVRNARHLLVLAPIPPKTREDVIHSAARADAMIKWLRRDIWRMKCHRDILAMDVKLDGLSTAELDRLAQEHLQQQAGQDLPSKKEKPNVLTRLSSSKVVTAKSPAKSPPQSPVTITAGRPSMTSSNGEAMDGEVFRTPPESSSPTKEDRWSRTSLKLDGNSQDAHRPSVTSTLLTASPTAGCTSPSHASSASSALDVKRSNSIVTSEVPSRNGQITPANSMDDSEARVLARAAATPEPTTSYRGVGPDGAAAQATPESARHKGVRRSLQKTLRDAQHHHHGNSHRHRRGKESESTVRSGGADDRELDEGTPGLARDKPRFILHGKQASVVQFGGDWERMKQRREQYAKERSGSPAQKDHDVAWERRRSERHELIRAGQASPIIQEFARAGGVIDDEEDDDGNSILSGRTPSFREDAEVAAAFALDGPTVSPRRMSTTSGDSDPYEDLSPSFDLSYWDPVANKRQTAIGPSHPPTTTRSPHRRISSLEKAEDGTVRLVEESDSDEPGYFADSHGRRQKGDRRTVIGPFPAAAGNGTTGGDKQVHHRGWLGNSAAGGAAAEGDDDDETTYHVITDEELREVSGGQRAAR